MITTFENKKVLIRITTAANCVIHSSFLNASVRPSVRPSIQQDIHRQVYTDRYIQVIFYIKPSLIFYCLSNVCVTAC